MVFGTFLLAQWLRPHAPNAVGMGSVPGWGTKIPHSLHSMAKKTNKKNVYFFLTKWDGYICVYKYISYTYNLTAF